MAIYGARALLNAQMVGLAKLRKGGCGSGSCGHTKHGKTQGQLGMVDALVTKKKGKLVAKGGEGSGIKGHTTEESSFVKTQREVIEASGVSRDSYKIEDGKIIVSDTNTAEKIANALNSSPRFNSGHKVGRDVIVQGGKK